MNDAALIVDVFAILILALVVLLVLWRIQKLAVKILIAGIWMALGAHFLGLIEKTASQPPILAIYIAKISLILVLGSVVGLLCGTEKIEN